MIREKNYLKILSEFGLFLNIDNDSNYKKLQKNFCKNNCFAIKST